VSQVRARRKPGAVADATITREEGALQVEQVCCKLVSAIGASAHCDGNRRWL